MTVNFNHLRPKVKLSSREKKAVHLLVITFIGWSLWAEGAGHADWSFLLLSLLCEAND